MTALTTADLGRLVLGVGVLARPDVPIRLTGSPDGTGVRRTVRVLGARYLVQSVGGSLVRRRWVRVADVGVDLVHAATMLALAGWAPRHRRLALASAAAALAFAGLDHQEELR